MPKAIGSIRTVDPADNVVTKIIPKKIVLHPAPKKIILRRRHDEPEDA